MSEPLALIIEDYEDQTFVFQKALVEAGFETEVIGDGAQAWTRRREVVPAVIMLDLPLPGVSGDSLLQQIRADERLADVRVFLATADDHLAEALRGQAVLVLLKPVTFAQLTQLTSRFRAFL